MEGNTKVAAAVMESDAQKVDRECREAALRGEWSSQGLYGVCKLLNDIRQSGRTTEEMMFGILPFIPLVEQALQQADTIPRDQFEELDAHPTLAQQGGYTGAQLLAEVRNPDSDDLRVRRSLENVGRMIELVAKSLEREEKKAGQKG